MKIKYDNYKIKTEINGLDDLLFGGLQLQTIKENTVEKPLIIVLRGELGTSRALLAMQLLHGITKSIRGLKTETTDGIEIGHSIFYTKKKSVHNISDMLVDTVISKCINKIVETAAKGDQGKWQNNQFCQTIFEVPQSTNLAINLQKLDYYVSQEIIVYNSRTNALHVASPSKAFFPDILDNQFVICRRHDNLGEYCKEYYESSNKKEHLKSCKPLYSENLDDNLSQEFFDIKIVSEECKGDSQLKECCKEMNGKKIPCIVLDREYSCMDKALEHKALVIIYIESKDTDIETYNADLIIEMRNYTDPKTEYLCHQISIVKSTLQDTAHGWHQYKKRDYGIEVYPSAHVILQRRRHMPKGVLRGQMDILSETYQHFIDEKKDYNYFTSLSEFITRNSSYKEDNLRRIYENFSKGECSEEILQNILIGDNDSKCQVTAIIGPANTYKRHLTLGGTFSTCCKEEHTLNILLDKEDNIILQKMICPASIFKNPQGILKKKCLSCIECYKYIHFKEIRMGCITSDEFFYYLIQQLRVSKESFNENKKIKRIVIDDLQKIEFCFPMINKDSLFLTGLISICKDYDVDLFILCDKSSEKVEALRAQADNVICTERTPDYDLNIYIEHYSGPSFPSHIWGCHITDIKDLFYCDIMPDGKKYKLNEKSIRSFSVYSMENYWKK